MQELFQNVKITDILTVIIAVAVPVISYLVDQYSKGIVGRKVLFKSEHFETQIKIFRYMYYFSASMFIATLESMIYFHAEEINLSEWEITVVYISGCIMMLAGLWLSSLILIKPSSSYISKCFNSKGEIIIIRLILIYIVCSILGFGMAWIIFAKTGYGDFCSRGFGFYINPLYLALAELFFGWYMTSFQFMDYIRKQNSYLVEDIDVWTKNRDYKKISNLIGKKNSIEFNYEDIELRRILIPKSELMRIEYVFDENQLLIRVQERKKLEKRKVRLAKAQEKRKKRLLKIARGKNKFLYKIFRVPSFLVSDYFLEVPDWHIAPNAPDEVKDEFELWARGFYCKYLEIVYPDILHPYVSWDGGILPGPVEIPPE